MRNEQNPALRPVKGWRTSSHSRNQTACVEVADFAGASGMRDSKNRDRAAIVLSSGEWSAFVKAVKLSEL